VPVPPQIAAPVRPRHPPRQAGDTARHEQDLTAGGRRQFTPARPSARQRTATPCLLPAPWTQRGSLNAPAASAEDKPVRPFVAQDHQPVITKETIRSLLQHPIYTGIVGYHGTLEGGRRRKRPIALYTSQHPPLVDMDVFESCQRVRRALGFACRSRDSERQTRVYLLSGLLRCGQCGGVMRAQTTVRGLQ
jgi:hypothetical protein